MARLIAIMLLLCSVFPLSAQNAPVELPLALTVTPGKKPKSLHLMLRNTSQAPVHLRLGTDNGGLEDFNAFSFSITDPHGRAMKFEALGFPMTGVVEDANAELAPGQAWNGDIDLQTLVLMEHLKDLVTADQLETGFYTIQATFEGRTSQRPVKGLPYWLGTIQSPPISYVIPM